jgi:nucleotide-binding universal stress UspA family protein
LIDDAVFSVEGRETTHKRILVAVDGSSTSDAALKEALGLAKQGDEAVRIVHVTDSPYSYPDIMYGHIPGDLEEVHRAWRKAGQEVLDSAVQQAQQACVKVEPVLMESKGERVTSAIVQEAKAWNADLIVVGTHGRRGLDRLLLGSVAEGVARTAPVTVLLVRRVQA